MRIRRTTPLEANFRFVLVPDELVKDVQGALAYSSLIRAHIDLDGYPKDKIRLCYELIDGTEHDEMPTPIDRVD